MGFKGSKESRRGASSARKIRTSDAGVLIVHRGVRAKSDEAIRRGSEAIRKNDEG